VALNENHRRALVAGFGSIDKTLREIEANIAAASASPFATYAVDFTAVEQRTISDYVGRARAQMVDGLRSVGIELRPNRSSVRGPIQTGLTFAGIGIDELAPSRLKGYGGIDDASRVALERTLADLARTLRTLRTYVSRDPSTDARTRLDAVTDAPADLRLVRTLDEVIARRGLVELRASLVAVVERLETRTFDIAVFGRVSCGKSSLLNAVLRSPLLPVGITPVTAFPTRITWGAEAAVVVSREGQADEHTSVEKLPDFVTEQLNPDNTKRVTKVRVSLPIDVLRDTVTLVDTPGVGSLARMGARETYAYLPTCDLGIVVLDGMAPTGADDFGLLGRLLDSGIDVRVVFSKADLVRDDDRVQLSTYFTEAARRELGATLEPAWVSSVGDAPSARPWFEQEIAPLIAESQRHAKEAGRRRIERLRQSVIASLRADADPQPRPEANVAQIDALGADAERLLELTEQRLERTISTARDQAPELVRDIATRVAQRPAGERIASSIESAVTATAERARRALRDEITTARDSLARMLSAIAAEVGERDVDVELQVDFLAMPVPIVPAALRAFSFDARRWPAPLRKERITSRLVDTGGDGLVRMLSNFGMALRTWARAALLRLGEQFAAQADPLRARARHTGPPGADRASLLADLQALGVTGAGAPGSG
jgi:GTP-binding protein EngB required for normal cell division